MQIQCEIKNRSVEERQTLTEWQTGRWHPQLPERALQCALANPSADNLYLALKIHHALREPDADSLAAVETLMCQSTHQFFWSSLSLRLLCAYLQSGRMEAAHSVVQRYMPGKPNVLATLRARRFPTALAFFTEQYEHLLNNKLQRQAKLAQRLLRLKKSVDERLFLDLHSNKPDNNATPVTVAVVGNAPSLLDVPRGRHIDEHDVVVRFNTPVLTEKYQLYSGQRTDVWVLSPNVARKVPLPNVQTMIVSGINILAGESGYWQHLAKYNGERQLALFRQEIWYQLAARLQAPPTAGLLLLTSLARTKGLRVSAFGFSGKCNVSSVDTNALKLSVSRGPGVNHYADSQSASTRHNWAAEAEMLTEWHKTTKG